MKPNYGNPEVNNLLISGDILWTKFILHPIDVLNTKMDACEGDKIEIGK